MLQVCTYEHISVLPEGQYVPVGDKTERPGLSTVDHVSTEQKHGGHPHPWTANPRRTATVGHPFPLAVFGLDPRSTECSSSRAGSPRSTEHGEVRVGLWQSRSTVSQRGSAGWLTAAAAVAAAVAAAAAAAVAAAVVAVVYRACVSLSTASITVRPRSWRVRP